MPGILDMLKSRVHHASSGGILSSLTGGGGMLSTAIGPLQARLASVQAAGTPQAKIQAFTSTLGARLRTPGGILSAGGPLANLGKNLPGLSGGTTGSATGPSMDAAYQVSGAGRVYGSPNPPPGLQYR